MILATALQMHATPKQFQKTFLFRFNTLNVLSPTTTSTTTVAITSPFANNVSKCITFGAQRQHIGKSMVLRVSLLQRELL